MENKNGEALLHSDATPKTNNFGDKITEKSADMQVPTQSAYADLMDIVTNPSEPEEDSIYVCKQANSWLMDASKLPEMKPLYAPFWNEGEVCILFSDSNLGKTILGMQIAEEVARSRRVLYFDYELSVQQFGIRYRSKDGVYHNFPDNLFRCEIDPLAMDDMLEGDLEQNLIEGIEKELVNRKAQVVVIDNLSYLCMASEKGESAGQLMKALIRLKKKYGISMLTLHHTPKRSLCAPITQNDMQGSKRIFNFIDSCFAIGKSCQGENIRYIKQLKTRNEGFTHGSDSVLTCEIIKDVTSVRFRTLRCEPEKNHLLDSKEMEDAQLSEKAKSMYAEGKKQREIADELAISLGKVNKLLKQ